MKKLKECTKSSILFWIAVASFLAGPAGFMAAKHIELFNFINITTKNKEDTEELKKDISNIKEDVSKIREDLGMIKGYLRIPTSNMAVKDEKRELGDI